MQEPVKHKQFSSFSDMRTDYFTGDLQSGDMVGIGGVKVLQIIGGRENHKMLLLGDQGQVPMWASLDNIIDASANLAELNTGRIVNARAKYVNHSPKQPSLNFPDQPQPDEYLAIKEITYPNKNGTIQATQQEEKIEQACKTD
ncbi:MAG: hypothetical protein AABX74_02580 [Nanoarchaeota archaeon]